MEERQHALLKALRDLMKGVAEERPADSENEDEEAIWDMVDDLSEALEEFFQEDKS